MRRIVSSLCAGAFALAIPASSSLAFAQEPGWEAPLPSPQDYTQVRVTPPPYGVVYLYEGRRLVGRFDRPGALYLPSGRSYRVVAMRGDQPIWTGYRLTTGPSLELRWAAPGEPCTCSAPPVYATPPTELGRSRTPWQ